MSKCKTIKLTKGKTSLIDSEDFERVSQHKWFARKYQHSDKFGVLGKVNGKMIYLHRFIINPPDKSLIDHINGNPLDNRKSNLRLATHAQNLYNRKTKNKTGYKGVQPCNSKKNPFMAYIKIQGKRVHLGQFKTAEEAARVYDTKAKEVQGEFAWLNFPLEANQ